MPSSDTPCSLQLIYVSQATVSISEETRWHHSVVVSKHHKFHISSPPYHLQYLLLTGPHMAPPLRPLPHPLDHWFPFLPPVSRTNINTHIIDVCTSPQLWYWKEWSWYWNFYGGDLEEPGRDPSTSPLTLSVCVCVSRLCMCVASSLPLHYKWLWNFPKKEILGIVLTFILAQ